MIQFTLHILIPCLIIAGNKLSFFTVISLAITLLFLIYVKYFHYFSLYSKIYQGLIVLLLIFHHFAFFFMYYLSLIDTNRLIALADYSKVAGLIVIFTILLGTLI